MEALLAALRPPGPPPPAHPPWPSWCVLDSRPPAEFARCHLRGATWLPAHGEVDDDEDVLLHQLTVGAMMPPDGVAMRILAVVGPAARWDRFRLVAEVALDPWTENDFPEDVLVRGEKESRTLWRPSPTIPAWLNVLPRPQDAKIIAVDLGCGVGRDVVALAMTLPDATVHAVDMPRMLPRCRRFAEWHGVSENVITHALDLAPKRCDQTPDKDPIRLLLAAHGDVNVIIMSRFMNRPALLTLSRFATPGTYVLIHHFLDGATSRTGRAFKAKEEATLHKGELETEFFGPKQGFDVLVNDIATLLDERPAISFVARRRKA